MRQTIIATRADSRRNLYYIGPDIHCSAEQGYCDAKGDLWNCWAG